MSVWQKSAGDMAHPRGRGLRDNEIEYTLSDSEIELEDGEIDELCEDGDLDTAYVPPPEESSSSDDDEPLSDLRTTRGRARGRPHRAASGRARRSASSRGRSRSRSTMRIVQMQ
ncbi:hypothetical protein O0L34_g4013 [Tuta absoluta]|nr:hypothetical protein O0L34_g4013 [Tuta absoluta]